MSLPFDLAPGAFAVLVAASFIAAFVRGYSGFGFAALVITPGSLVTDPLNLVPMVVIADIGMTIWQARGIRAQVQWWRVRWLFAGCLAGVPVGVWVMGALLVSGWKARRATGPRSHLATGVISGLANGAGVGGLPVAVFFAAQPISAAAFRATNIAYYTALDLWTLPVMVWSGLVSADTLLLALMLAAPMLAGLWLGGKRFLAAEPASFRRFATLLLAGMAVLALGRSLT